MNKKNIIDWSILLVLSIIWGSSFILMKKSLIVFNYLEVGLFRIIISFLVLCPFLLTALKKIQISHILPLLIVSFIGTVIPAIIFAKSQMFLDSSLIGMLNSLTPIFTFTISILIFRKKIHKINILGIFIGLVGTFVLLTPIEYNSINTKYSLLILLATLCYALSINTIKEKLSSLRPIDIAVLSSFMSSVVPVIYFLDSGLISNLENVLKHINYFLYLIILGFFCTSIAIILFNYLIQRSSALFASSTTYLIPIFAIIWGAIDFEIIDIKDLIGISIILIGVFIINFRKLES